MGPAVEDVPVVIRLTILSHIHLAVTVIVSGNRTIASNTPRSIPTTAGRLENVPVSIAWSVNRDVGFTVTVPISRSYHIRRVAPLGDTDRTIATADGIPRAVARTICSDVSFAITVIIRCDGFITSYTPIER